jgi:hypothetical protein
MTAYNFTKVAQVSKYIGGYPQTVVATLDLATTIPTGFANGDTVSGILIPPNATIVSWFLSFDELDTNGAPTGTFGIGDAGSASRFATGLAMGGSAASYNYSSQVNNPAPALGSNFIPSGGIGYKYDTSGGTIILTVEAAVATAATTGQLVLTVTYTDNAY